MQGNFTEPVLSIEPKISDLVELISRQVKKHTFPQPAMSIELKILEMGRTFSRKWKKKMVLKYLPHNFSRAVENRAGGRRLRDCAVRQGSVISFYWNHFF